MTNYRKGYRFELEVKEELESLGFKVFRMAGSHSCFDLIAFPKFIGMPHDDLDIPFVTPYFIQCKAGRNPNFRSVCIEAAKKIRAEYPDSFEQGRVFVWIKKDGKNRIEIEIGKKDFLGD